MNDRTFLSFFYPCNGFVENISKMIMIELEIGRRILMKLSSTSRESEGDSKVK